MAKEDYPRGLQSRRTFSAEEMLEFSKWKDKSGWTEHGNGYYYRSKDPHQWPADETCMEEDLLDAWRITQPLN